MLTIDVITLLWALYIMYFAKLYSAGKFHKITPSNSINCAIYIYFDWFMVIFHYFAPSPNDIDDKEDYDDDELED